MELKNKDDIIGDIFAAGVFIFAAVILPGIGYLLSSMDPALKLWLVLYGLVALWALVYLLAHLYERLTRKPPSRRAMQAANDDELDAVNYKTWREDRDERLSQG